jgi:hypothetical protein
VQRSGEALGDDTGADPQPRTFGELVARRGEIAGRSRMDFEAAMPRHQTPQPKSVVGLEGFEL